MVEFFGLAAGIVGLAGYIPYIRDTITGATKPERVSWLIWTIEYAALFAAQFVAGAHHSLWLIGLQLAGVVAVCILSVRHGVGGFDLRQRLLVGCVCLALVLWHTTQNVNVAITILLLVEASGVVMTAIKVYKQPGSETLAMWACVGVAGVLGTAAVGATAAIILYVYPISLVLMSAAVIGASLVGARRFNSNNDQVVAKEPVGI